MPHYPLSNYLLRLSEYDGFKNKEDSDIFSGLMKEYATLLDMQYQPLVNKDDTDWSLCTPSEKGLADLEKLLSNKV
tara:strand:+ start:452 stop:679 length:228 start_codon:yes stop_codon:yes gene_type:complete